MVSRTRIEKAKASFEQGNQFKERGDIAESIQSYQKAIQIQPEYKRPLNNLADIYESQENWLEATKCYQHLIGLEPSSHFYYVKLAKVLVKQNKIYGAIAAYQEALALNPDLPGKIYKTLGDLLLQDKDDTSNAISTYQKASEQSSDWGPGFYIQYANSLMQKQLIDEAIVNYDKAIHLKPDSENFYVLLGNAKAKKEELDNALNCYQKALELNPNLATVYKKIGDIYVQKNQLDIASRYYYKTLELKPDATYVYRCLGDVFTKQGRQTEAVDCYNRSKQ